VGWVESWGRPTGQAHKLKRPLLDSRPISYGVTVAPSIAMDALANGGWCCSAVAVLRSSRHGIWRESRRSQGREMSSN